MKAVSIPVIAAAVGLTLAIADRSGSQQPSVTTSYPPGCAVAVNGTQGQLPRAELRIENRLTRPVSAWLEPRYGLARVELGQIGEGELRVLAHTLPAGRNRLQAAPAKGPVIRIVLNVANRGAATCNRRYLWRIE